jgi:uncharacterized damage-inducible protein DinB
MFLPAGEDSRVVPPYAADERATLLGFLRWQRSTFELKCSGLDSGQLALRAVSPSSLSLLGLVRHLAEVERGWFRRKMGGQDAPAYFCTDADPDGDFDLVVDDPGMVGQAWELWRAEVAFADRLISDTADFGFTGSDPKRGTVSLRWVVMHLIEEYARHNGHADLLRQRIDGRVGE